MKHGMRRNDVLVGAVVVLGIVLVVAGTIWLKGARLGQEDRDIQARFTEVGQLLPGNAVKLRGVNIGEVETIELEPGARAVIITLRINAEIPLPEDPVVLLSPESFFGDWQAEIFPRRSYPLYNYAEAPDPSILPGYSLPDISRLTAVADRIAQNMAILSDRVETAFTEETALNIREAIENINQVSEELTGLVSGQQRAIQEVADNLQETTQALGQAAETVNRAFAQIETAISGDRLVSIVGNVERATAQTDSLARELLSMSRDLKVAAASADTTFAAINDIALRVQRGEGTIGKLLADTMLYYGLRESTIELQNLLRDIRENPRKYITIRVF
jgi:phospholipid/cholesterol/gamma-HCH transport system substrate-binding protein